MATITVSKSWEELATMDDNGMALYAPPGSNQPYWASHSSFMYDECVATPTDFEWSGIGYSREDECDEVFSAEVELLDPL